MRNTPQRTDPNWAFRCLYCGHEEDGIRTETEALEAFEEHIAEPETGPHPEDRRALVGHIFYVGPEAPADE